MLDDLRKLPFAEAEIVAWQFLLAAHELNIAHGVAVFLSYDSVARQVIVSSEPSDATCLHLDSAGVWSYRSPVGTTLQVFFDLYLPVLGNRTSSSMVIAHLGQSIDAQIATVSGDSFYVTGEQNRKHLHCLRALSDAVIVGASTIESDDPQLTTRAVPGDNPVRVIIDPNARLKVPLGVFSDAQAKTILVHQSSTDLSGVDMQFGPSIDDGMGNSTLQVERWVVPDTDTQLSAHKVIAMLADKQLKRVFIEGGGITVSRFFDAGCLDRLHVATAPLLVGQGRQALQIAGSIKMMNAHRPPCAIYRMGEDVLWDFDLGDSKRREQFNTCSQSERVGESDGPSVQRIL